MSSIKLEARIEELYQLNNFIYDEVQTRDSNLDLLVEEIFVNISMYSDCSYLIVNAEYDENTGNLHLEFVDDGIEFNPLDADEPVKADSVENAKIGGLGIYLFRNLSDTAEYEYIDGENHLTITKNVK